MGMKNDSILFLSVVSFFLVSIVNAEDKWVWSDKNRNDKKLNGNNDDYRKLSDNYETIEHRSEEEGLVYDGNFESNNRKHTFRHPSFNHVGPERLYPSPYPYPYPSGSNGVASNLHPNLENGVLIGPGGPTGIIGRPPIHNNGNGFKGHPVNGILVGPGGPTGIIGRPPSFSPGNYGPGAGTPSQHPNIPFGPAGSNYPLNPGKLRFEIPQSYHAHNMQSITSSSGVNLYPGHGGVGVYNPSAYPGAIGSGIPNLPFNNFPIPEYAGVGLNQNQYHLGQFSPVGSITPYNNARKATNSADSTEAKSIEEGNPDRIKKSTDKSETLQA